MQTIKTEGLVFIALAIIVFFVLLAFIVIALTVTYNRKKINFINQRKLREASFQQELLTTQIEIQEQTFKTVSQEIHDNIGQVLSLAKLNLGRFENIESEANEKRIESTKQLVSKALVDLRNLSRSMYGDQLQDLGLTPTIENELKILENTGQFKTGIVVTGSPFKLEAQKEIFIYRMIQEAIQNSIKHAEAKNINVEVNYNDACISLSVIDDGKGFQNDDASAPKNGMGLTSMKSRAAMIGGDLNIISNVDKGTVVSFSLPYTNTNK